MDLVSILNFYCRKIGIWFLALLPIILTSVLFFQIILPTDTIPEKQFIGFVQFVTVGIYILLILMAVPFGMNGFFMERTFNSEIKRIENTGLLIQGVEGFNDIESSIKLLYRASYSVSGTVIISFLVYISAILLEQMTPFAKIFIFSASIGLLAISSGASFLLKLPDKSVLQPGGLMRFYSPKSRRLKLDNILADSIFTRLDPITRSRMDEWSKSILEHFNVSYLKDFDQQTRLERAREKIFLMVYLKEFLPELMTGAIFQRELKEIIDPHYFDDFKKGWDSGISLKTLTTVIRDIEDEIPQIFELIHRIFVLVTDNLAYLQTKEEFMTITHPTSHVGNIDPFVITIFILNLKDIQRKVRIQAQTSMSSLDPDDASQLLLLDMGELNIPKQDTHLEFSSTSDPIDVLRLVSGILQIGDAINLQFRPNRFGTHVLNISLDDPETGLIGGRSVVIEVHRDLNYYVKTLGAKALGYAGAAISMIGIGLGSLIGLFGY
ncbi:MAG: hypothetical protein ACXAC8_14085 [Candidatus Hodarchaeales archaeon]|jgi:hypothetical protein